ncbi:MAG: flagellar protein FlgN [Acidimicrobiales bacterium]
MPRPASPPPLDELSDALWQVRRLLDVLRFRLEEERVLALADGRRWSATAHRAAEDVLERLRLAELVRAVMTEEVAKALDVGSAPTLRRLADAAPEPWGEILTSHLEALVTAARAIAELAEANERLAATSSGQAPAPTHLGPSLTEFLAG